MQPGPLLERDFFKSAPNAAGIVSGVRHGVVIVSVRSWRRIWWWDGLSRRLPRPSHRTRRLSSASHPATVPVLGLRSNL